MRITDPSKLSAHRRRAGTTQSLFSAGCERGGRFDLRRRAEAGKNYGVILIPEGILEFLPECKTLINELNSALASGGPEEAVKTLSAPSAACLQGMPLAIQKQLFHGPRPTWQCAGLQN